MKQFKELFNPLPGCHFLHVNLVRNDITSMLQDMVDGVDGELKVVEYDGEKHRLDQPFRTPPRDKDIVVLQDILSSHKHFEMLLKIVYTTLANTAEIIILEKKGMMDIEKTKELLLKYEFRTPNYIADILDGYDLVIAKKMHMWGNGL